MSTKLLGARLSNFSQNIYGDLKWLRRTKHVARIGDTKNETKILIAKSEMRNSLATFFHG
jgi:hypothetical protein